MKHSSQPRIQNRPADREPFERLSPGSGRPVAKKRRKKKQPFGKAVIISVFVFALLLVVGVAGAVYLNQLLGLVDRTPITGDSNLQESDLVDPNDMVDQPDSSNGVKDAEDSYDKVTNIDLLQSDHIYNILLIGSDMRDNETVGRSDAMIIMSINKETQKIHLTSLMRAMYVSIPGKGWSMLNHSFAWGGSDLLLKTIENNLRIKIDDYMVVNFSGFTKVIDQVDGIDIDLTSKEATYINNELQVKKYKEGVNHLNGEAALSYARIRKIDTDFKRTGRQRTVIESLVAKSRKLNPVQLTDLAKALLPLVKTNLSQAEMLSMLVDMMSARNYPVSQLMLPLEDSREMIYVRKMEMYRFDFAENIKALHDFINE